MRLSAVNKYLLPRTVWQRAFLVTLFFVTIASLLFWLDFFRVYKSEISVLVITRSPNVVTEQVAVNFTDLAKNLSFYERVLSQNDLIDDDFEGQPKDKRKALWNHVVTVTHTAKSGVLMVSALQETAEKARLLSQETVKALFSVAAFYYNIKTDIDLRIVDEPIVKPVVSDPLWYGLTSFGSAFGVTTLFFLALSFAPYLFRGKKRTVSFEHNVKGTAPEKAYPDFAIGDAVPFIDPRKFVPARPATLSFESFPEEEKIRQEILDTVPENTVITNPLEDASSEKLLPGMDIDVSELPFRFEEVAPEKIKSEEKAVSVTETAILLAPPVIHQTIVPREIKRGEPSIEEYKRRLNELLAGGK